MLLIDRLLAWRSRNLSYSAILCLLSGALLPLSMAPHSYWPIALIAPSVLALAITFAQSRKGIFALSFLFGLGMFGSGVSWVYVSIHDFGFTGVGLAILLTSIFVVFLAAVFALPTTLAFNANTRYSMRYAFAFSAVWVLGEWLRSWIFSGFPWLYVGYAQVDTPLKSFAPLAGVFALSFISLAHGTTLIAAIKHALESKSARRPVVASFGIIGLWAFAFAIQNIQWTKNTGDTVSVAILQPNVALEKKWNPLEHGDIYRGLYAQSSQHWDKDIQLWPEAAVPSLLSDASVFLDDINETALSTNTAVFSGVLVDNENGGDFEVYNGLAGFGAGSGTYFKQKLVPFGEYVPFEKHLRGLIQFFDLPNSVIKKGPFKANALRGKTAEGIEYNIAPLICYEVVYPDFVARHAQQATLLFTISNDAWFGQSDGPFQHFEMARMRAIENQKTLVRSTNTGISGFINARGEVIKALPQFKADTLSAELALIEGSTPFAKTGSWPTIIGCVLLLFSHWFYLRRSNRVNRE